MIHRVGRDMNYIRKALQQRKSFTIINMKGLVNMLDAVEYLQANPARFSYPFLIMQGGEDRIVSNEGALRWVSKVDAKIEREQALFPEMVHELHKEPGKEKVVSRALQYLIKQTTGQGSNPIIWQKPAAGSLR